MYIVTPLLRNARHTSKKNTNNRNGNIFPSAVEWPPSTDEIG